MLQETHLHALDMCAVQHRSHFLATARRVLGDSAAAQDAVQDPMLSAARNLHRFRGDSQLSTWLGRIVINAALTRRRALRRRPEESLDTLLERGAASGSVVGHQSRGRPHASFISTGPSQERTLLRAEISSMLRSAVDRLPNDYRTVVILRHYEDHRVAEIASRLQITQNAVKLRLLRAHRALRGQLAKRGCVITIR
jgi:RNA polymerase sigma-70 factor (ECF subfamily)